MIRHPHIRYYRIVEKASGHWVNAWDVARELGCTERKAHRKLRTLARLGHIEPTHTVVHDMWRTRSQ